MNRPSVDPSREEVVEATGEEAGPHEFGRRIFRRILVLVDFAVSPHRAVGSALELRRAFGSEVCLFEMPELTGGDEFLAGLGSPSVIDADLGEEAKGRLARFLMNVFPDAVGTVELRSRTGVDPVATLKQEAHRSEATLVIAAARSHGGIFLRSPAERMIHDFDIPVLLLPT